MVEGLISLTLFTTKGVTTKPLLGLVVTNGLALVGGTAVGGLVTYPLIKRRERQEKERLSEALEHALGQAEEADGLRQELADAQAEINQLLSNAAEMAQLVETAEAPEEDPPDVSVDVPEAPEAVEAPVPDDLKKIKGIGKVFERRLNEAGIWTFADLVEMDPEKLREIVSSGRVENMIQPEEWIEQAREWVE